MDFKQRWVTCSLAVLLLTLAPAAAQAWGLYGHQLVAELAERQLSQTSRDALQPLLREAGAAHLADVAGWADEAREQRRYHWSARLHFVNHPDTGCDYQPGRDCRDGACVVLAVERFRNELADRSLTLPQRSEALKFLVHFVGDIHQPLHAGYASDKGGNTVQLRIRGRGANLHRLWDYELLESRQLDLADYVAQLAQAPLPEPGSRRPRDWAAESCAAVGAAGFYPDDNFQLPSYLERFRPQAEQRIRLAAARLARDLELALTVR